MSGAHEQDATIGRPVRVVSIGFDPAGKSLDDVTTLVDAEGAKGCDLIILPEASLENDRAEPMDGPMVTAMSDLARRHHTNLICPILRADGRRRFNTAVLLDRAGRIVGHYDKVYPYWGEYDLDPPVSVGQAARVFETDFGRLGVATCFDVNFPALWQALADAGAEMIAWPSAYSAGTSLQAHALNHHFYIVSATWLPDCNVYDITGQPILYERSDQVNVSRITLDLDRCIFHQNFNWEKREKLLAERSEDMEQELFMELEQWFVLRAKRPGISARALARTYCLEELRDYLTRSRRSIDTMRAGPFTTPDAS